MANLPDFFGVDIGNHALKVAQVKREGPNNAKILRLGNTETPFGLLDNESEEGVKRLAELIESARKAAGIETKNFVAAVPESAVFSRLLSVPKVAVDQLEQTVHWEIKPMLPVPLEEVDIAFLDIDERQEAGRQMLDIYAVAAPKVLTDRYRHVAHSAGLELLALETEALALTRSVSFSNRNLQGDIVMIDFGAASTNIVLARDGVVVFSQTSSTGSDSFTKAIGADYGIDMVQAEKYKRAFGIDFQQGEGKIAKAIDPIMQILVNDIIRSINFFRDRVGGKLASMILLTGDGANLPGLATYLQSKLNITCQVANSFEGFGIDGKLKDQIADYSAPGYSVAIGLGLKDTDS